MTSESAFDCDALKPSSFLAQPITISNDVSKSRVEIGYRRLDARVPS